MTHLDDISAVFPANLLNRHFVFCLQRRTSEGNVIREHISTVRKRRHSKVVNLHQCSYILYNTPDMHANLSV